MENKEDIIEYISIYCTHFYNEFEKAAMNHHIAKVKFLPYKDKLKKMADAYERNTSTNPKVLELLKNGIQEFQRRASERIFNEHFDELNLNRCPKCNGITRTPKAKQCRYCQHNWH
ncbi:hypothetical protein [Chondrinema litorale]|uniref:hypothetical protein n=1 Tax=Chondrinema litorale TaxID=2994555 RepID=UPI0025436EA1|nr:hypothetical protein [Chondrinema litorale]UZR98710.1 hypothetical protein OQ292_32390 [Chondrinema litorale]